MTVDIAFRLSSSGPIPADHGYLLYASLCRQFPWLHESTDVAVHAICGRQCGSRLMALTSNSRLVIRASIGVLSRFGDLREIQIADAVLLVGSFEVRRLTPRPNLRSRIVTVKLSRSPSVSEDAFRSALHDKLVSIGITSGRLMVGQRRTMAVKRRQIVGYEVRLANLSPGDSLLVQENGIGGRRKMGAGVFHVT